MAEGQKFPAIIELARILTVDDHGGPEAGEIHGIVDQHTKRTGCETGPGGEGIADSAVEREPREIESHRSAVLQLQKFEMLAVYPLKRVRIVMNLRGHKGCI